MNILVTGGGGFLGFHIVKKLVAEGHQVTVIGRNVYPKVVELGAQSLAVDIRDRDAVASACAGMEEVYHVAALAGIWGEWQDYFDINVKGTEKVIAACKKQGVKRLVYTSSPSVVFNGESQRDGDESMPYSKSWLTHYPKSKMMGEKLVLKANSEDLKTVALRPHLIWGPGDMHIIPRLVNRAKKGQLARVGTGDNRVDIIYVENAAEAHLLAAKELAESGNCAGRTFFLGQNQPVKLWDFIDKVLEKEGLPPVKRSIPFPVAYGIGSCFEFFYRAFRIKEEPRMTRFVACQLAKDHYYSHKQAEETFGYNASISVDEGLRRLYPSAEGVSV